MVTRKQTDRDVWTDDGYQREEIFRIHGLTCIFRPVNDFLNKLRKAKEQKERNKIFIRYSFKEAQGFAWSRWKVAPGRPFESVILDEALKSKIVEDITAFIKQASFYHSRGIPYRRGYLFDG
jgi:hypothetical protein